VTVELIFKGQVSVFSNFDKQKIFFVGLPEITGYILTFARIF